MMGCKGKTPVVLFDARKRVQDQADSKHLFAVRFNWCAHASGCNRLCAQLLKGPGVAAVQCVDLKTGDTVDLYPALADPAFRCPAGRF